MPITSANELVTSRQETRAGFIEFALEKNRRSKPFIDSAKAFRHFAYQAKVPSDLLKIKEIREPLLTASGLSDKSLKYFTDEDKIIAIKELIKNFLEPAGTEFVDEVVYRYLLIKGDSLGGSIRNIIGALAQQKLIRSLLSVMTVQGINYYWLSGKSKEWRENPNDDYAIENDMKAISWTNTKGARTFTFNLDIPIVGNNIDLCLFSCDPKQFDNGKIVNTPSAAVMLGELKGGIDPAGADEHWKTANTALERIRSAFTNITPLLNTSFVGAAIEASMAQEIYTQILSGKLSFASNLTKTKQVYEYCAWILTL
ncbi:MAG: type II restriction endonuclease [Desulfarculales bacterium]|jgi:type II restriction enzyme|nr:type II restriction endonuclease [Desulfarculales bacterium]